MRFLALAAICILAGCRRNCCHTPDCEVSDRKPLDAMTTGEGRSESKKYASGQSREGRTQLPKESGASAPKRLLLLSQDDPIVDEHVKSLFQASGLHVTLGGVPGIWAIAVEEQELERMRLILAEDTLWKSLSPFISNTDSATTLGGIPERLAARQPQITAETVDGAIAKLRVVEPRLAGLIRRAEVVPWNEATVSVTYEVRRYLAAASRWASAAEFRVASRHEQAYFEWTGVVYFGDDGAVTSMKWLAGTSRSAVVR